MPNTNGYTGLVVSQNSDDNVTICGLDPNNNPSCIVDPHGRSRDDLVFSGTQGMFSLPNSYSEVKSVDNSGDHEGGAYTVVAMNKFNVDAGGGGINLNSSGNITLMGLGGIVNIVSHTQIEAFSEIIKLDATDITIINGPTLDINSKIINCKNLTIFHTNAAVKGSLMVGGELYTTHITGPKEKFDTENHPPMTVFFDKGMVFKGILSIQQLAPSGPYMPTSAVVNAELLLPDPRMLMTKAGWTPEHKHDFYHLAADLTPSQLETWEEASAIEDAQGPLAAKPPTNFINSLKTMVTDKVTTAIKTVINNFSIF